MATTSNKAHEGSTFFAHKHPGITPNLESEEYKDGYASRKAGCWWRGCSYCHDTQEFADWQAGWHKAYNENQ